MGTSSRHSGRSSKGTPLLAGAPDLSFVSATSFVQNHPEFGLTAKQLTTLAIHGDMPCRERTRGQRTFRFFNFTQVRDRLVSPPRRKRRRPVSTHSHKCSKCGHIEACGTRQRRVAKKGAAFIIKAQWPDGDLCQAAAVEVREIRRNA